MWQFRAFQSWGTSVIFQFRQNTCEFWCTCEGIELTVLNSHFLSIILSVSIMVSVFLTSLLYFFFKNHSWEFLFLLLGHANAGASIKNGLISLWVQCSWAESDKSQISYLSRKPCSPLGLAIWELPSLLFTLSSPTVEVSYQMNNYYQRKRFIESMILGLQALSVLNHTEEVSVVVLLTCNG